MAESRRTQAQVSIYTLPVELHGWHLILPTTMCDNTSEVWPTREAYPSLAV